jgi:hypothetical protein
MTATILWHAIEPGLAAALTKRQAAVVRLAGADAVAGYGAATLST